MSSERSRSSITFWWENRYNNNNNIYSLNMNDDSCSPGDGAKAGLFVLKTDHEAIRFLMRSKPPSGRLFRWMEILKEYDFEVEHVAGRLIPHVDALSRLHEGADTDAAEKTQSPKQLGSFLLAVWFLVKFEQK